MKTIGRTTTNSGRPPRPAMRSWAMGAAMGEAMGQDTEGMAEAMSEAMKRAQQEGRR